ncbi:MAG TPA: MFS transporter [Patescibacteria group bacterium]|nr:MFS transporter [Patescibacteria group bacterium]
MKQTAANSLRLKFYTFSFFDDFILIYPLYTLLFADRGVSAAKISSLLFAWSLTAFLLEVPSGAIADKFNRKYVLLTGLAFRALGFTFWLLMPNYWGFLIGFICWGIKSALTSGTLEALLYDELAKVEETKRYAKISGRMEALSLVAVTAAGLGASILAPGGYALLLVLSIVAIVVSAVAIAVLPSQRRVQSTGETQYLHYLRSGVHEAIRHPVVLLAVLALSLIIGLGAADEYFELLFRENGLSNAAVSFWYAVLGVCGVVGAVFAHKFEHTKRPTTIILVALGCLLAATGLMHGLTVPIVVGVFALVFASAKVLLGADLQHAISDTARATTTSVSGLLSEVAALFVFGVVGLSSQLGNYSVSFRIVGAALLVLAVLFGCAKAFIVHKQGR